LDGGKRCQCCDCGTERAQIRFAPAVIRAIGKCETCETPLPHTAPDEPVVFEKGHAHQMLFALPLGLQHGYSSFSMNITIKGNFKRTADNDPLIGFMDDTHQAWLAQRGDNGVWMTLGQVVHDSSNKTLLITEEIEHQAQ
jgi:hypothetical protein